jgi:hypothetical protein
MQGRVNGARWDSSAAARQREQAKRDIRECPNKATDKVTDSSPMSIKFLQIPARTRRRLSDAPVSSFEALPIARARLRIWKSAARDQPRPRRGFWNFCGAGR